MPFVFGIVGVVFLVAGVRGTSDDLLKLLKGDLTGPNNYIYWMLSIFILGSLGYIQDFRALSRAFLVLVLVVLILYEGDPKRSGGGFFKKFTDAMTQITGPTQAAA